MIHDCYDALGKDCERVRATIRVDARNGTGERMETKVLSVEKRLGRELVHVSRPGKPT